MLDLDRIAAASGILVDPAGGDFVHHATAWSLGDGGWLTVWDAEAPLGDSLRLLCAVDGSVHAPRAWERDGEVVAFTCDTAAAALVPAVEPELRKRQALTAVGYPSVIDHPAFALARGSIDCERYIPYLCPWRIPGHLALFTRDSGFLTGESHPGMCGGPVVAEDGHVVGILADTPAGTPPLTRFVRIAAGS